MRSPMMSCAIHKPVSDQFYCWLANFRFVKGPTVRVSFREKRVLSVNETQRLNKKRL